MSGAVRGSDLVDPPPVTRNPPPQRAREGRRLPGIGGPQPPLEKVAGASDEPEQNRQRRLPTSRLVRTDHALRDAGPLGELALRHPGALPRLPHKGARRLDDRHPPSIADRQYFTVPHMVSPPTEGWHPGTTSASSEPHPEAAGGVAVMGP